MVNDKNSNDYKEDSTMREIHRIQEEMEQQYKKSGLSSYWEWLQATEADMHQSLAEVGFAIVTRDGRTFIDEIEPHSKRKSDKAQTGKTRNFKLSSHSTKSETAKHKNYDDFLEDLSAPELHLVRKEGTVLNKIEPQPQRKHAKYKTAAKQSKTNSHKK